MPPLLSEVLGAGRRGPQGDVLGHSSPEVVVDGWGRSQEYRLVVDDELLGERSRLFGNQECRSVVPQLELGEVDRISKTASEVAECQGRRTATTKAARRRELLDKARQVAGERTTVSNLDERVAEVTRLVDVSRQSVESRSVATGRHVEPVENRVQDGPGQCHTFAVDNGNADHPVDTPVGEIECPVDGVDNPGETRAGLTWVLRLLTGEAVEGSLGREAVPQEVLDFPVGFGDEIRGGVVRVGLLVEDQLVQPPEVPHGQGTTQDGEIGGHGGELCVRGGLVGHAYLFGTVVVVVVVGGTVVVVVVVGGGVGASGVPVT